MLALRRTAHARAAATRRAGAGAVSCRGAARGIGAPASSGARRRASSPPSPPSAVVSGLDSGLCAVLGGQWGDEGKGKLVDILAGRYDLVARFNGGHNAGHTLVVDGRKFAFHVLPCGLLYPGKMNVIGNGVVVESGNLFRELAQLDEAGIDYDGRLKISDRAHVLFRIHQSLDQRQEEHRGGGAIGTTGRGIGPSYQSKAGRGGVRMGDLVDFDVFAAKARALAKHSGAEGAELAMEEDLQMYNDEWRARLLPMIADTTHLVQEELAAGRRVLCEGANAVMLDLDHGTYPYVTSSSTGAGGICTGLGLPPSAVEHTIGIVKAYTTRVGAGPFPTELDDATGQHLRDVGGEYGTTTGRPRRCGWLDVPAVRYGARINGYSSINITKLDVLDGVDEIRIATGYELDGEPMAPGRFPGRLEDLARVRVQYESVPGWNEPISKCRSYADLPAAARGYVERIEQLVGTPVSWIGVGPGREDMVTKF